MKDRAPHRHLPRPVRRDHPLAQNNSLDACHRKLPSIVFRNHRQVRYRRFHRRRRWPFPLPSWPWHDAQYARYKSGPSTERISGGNCFSESWSVAAVGESLRAFAAIPPDPAAITATVKHHKAARIFTTILPLKSAPGTFCRGLRFVPLILERTEKRRTHVRSSAWFVLSSDMCLQSASRVRYGTSSMG